MAEKKTTKKKIEKYTAEVSIMGKVTKAQGKTVYEAIENLKPGNVQSRVILTVAKGDTAKEAIIPPVLAKRLFNTAGVTREVHLKNASLLFEGI